MSYRIQEILRMIIPGLYLITMLLVQFLIGGGWGNIPEDERSFILDVLKSVSGVLVLLLPFIGFVAGYLANSFSNTNTNTNVTENNIKITEQK